MAELDLGKVVGRDGTIVKRNLLDNSDFRNPVNQRGATTYNTNNAYAIDRWIIENGTCWVVANSFVSVSAGGYLVQRVPAHVMDETKTYTLATMDTAGNVNVAEAAGMVLFDDGTHGYHTVKILAGEYIWAALYEGSYTADTLPEYIPKGYAAELMECQRYYQQYGVVGLTCRNNGYATTLLPVTMRVAPTISVGTRRLYTTSHEDVSGTYSNTLAANTTAIFFNNSFYEGFVTITCNDVSLSADL